MDIQSDGWTEVQKNRGRFFVKMKRMEGTMH